MTVVALCLLFALGAALYSSVGHGGASAYIAAMALFSIAPEAMKPTALALNLLVAGFGTWRYARRGLTNWKLVLAFALTATPAAFIGGAIHLPAIVYKPLVGILLWVAAARLLWQPKMLAERETRAPPLWITLPAGAVLGLLAGLTGTGGGIFLSPLIILNAWEEPRHTSGVVAAFILLNSIAGLAGNAASVGNLPAQLPLFLASVGAGALLGTWLGVERLPRPWLLRTLGARFATGLRRHLDPADDHRSVDRLQHVEQGKAGDRDGGQRLHLDARLSLGADLRIDAEAGQRLIGRDPNLDMGQWQRMAQRNELGGALGGHDPGELGGGHDRALGSAPGAHLLKRFGLAGHDAARRCRADCRFLVRHVGHARSALVVDMTKAAHDGTSSLRRGTSPASEQGR